MEELQSFCEAESQVTVLIYIKDFRASQTLSSVDHLAHLNPALDSRLFRREMFSDVKAITSRKTP